MTCCLAWKLKNSSVDGCLLRPAGRALQMSGHPLATKYFWWPQTPALLCWPWTLGHSWPCPFGCVQQSPAVLPLCSSFRVITWLSQGIVCPVQTHLKLPVQVLWSPCIRYKSSCTFAFVKGLAWLLQTPGFAHSTLLLPSSLLPLLPRPPCSP